MSDWPGRWTGRTAVCIASGPSLTLEDCETVHASGLPTIVTNTTFRRCLWADALMAFDGAWWRAADETTKRGGWANYSEEVAATFKGERVACSKAAVPYATTVLIKEAWFSQFHNSGACAVSLAIAAGASRVILLGFDCQKTGGRVHWHPDHPAGLSNAATLKNWPVHFKNLARFAAARGVRIENASRETALKQFPRVALADALQTMEVAA